MAPRRQLTPIEMSELSRMFFELSHDPKTRKQVAKLVKEKFPDRAASFSDVDLQDQVQALRDEQEQREQVAEGRRAQEALNRQRGELITSGRYNEDQVQDIEKIIARHGSTLDYNTAAVLYAHENPPNGGNEGPPPDERTGATWEFPTVSGKDGKPIPFADFAKNPTAAAQNAAYQVITEFKRRNVSHR